MIGHARCTIIDHRFISVSGAFYRFNIAITGPKQSGKTTFFKVLTNEVIIDLISTDEWKKTFLFFFDASAILHNIVDVLSLYTSFIDLIFDFLLWQKPIFSSFIPIIKKQFKYVVELKQPPVFPKSFANNEATSKIGLELQEILNRLSSVWNDDKSLSPWVTNIFLLPLHISKIFGFNQMIYFIENLDVLDFEVSPSDTSNFCNSQESVNYFAVLEFVLSNSNFVVDSDKLKSAEFITTIDLMRPTKYQNNQFIIELEDVEEKLILNAESCGGVPAFISDWNEINDDCDNVVGNEDEDQKFMIISKLQLFTNKILRTKSNEEFRIKTFKRSSK